MIQNTYKPDHRLGRRESDSEILTEGHSEYFDFNYCKSTSQHTQTVLHNTVFLSFLSFYGSLLPELNQSMNACLLYFTGTNSGFRGFLSGKETSPIVTQFSSPAKQSLNKHIGWVISLFVALPVQTGRRHNIYYLAICLSFRPFICQQSSEHILKMNQ